MPELPEVETVVRALRPRLVGRTILAFVSLWRRQVTPSAARVAGELRGQRVLRVARRAKFIVWELADGTALLVHLRMSGRFEWADASGPRRGPHVRAEWTLDDGALLRFCDARKFGRILHTHDLQNSTGALGPEPLDAQFSAARLHELLRHRARRLKPLLLDQSVIAGLGNIYVDESLHRARLHPLSRADQLTPPQVSELHRAIRSVLRDAIRRNGTSFDWVYPGGAMQDHLYVYGRTGQPCRRCGTAIIALRVGQRGTHVCPTCQKL